MSNPAKEEVIAHLKSLRSTRNLFVKLKEDDREHQHPIKYVPILKHDNNFVGYDSGDIVVQSNSYPYEYQIKEGSRWLPLFNGYVSRRIILSCSANKVRLILKTLSQKFPLISFVPNKKIKRTLVGEQNQELFRHLLFIHMNLLIDATRDKKYNSQFLIYPQWRKYLWSDNGNLRIGGFEDHTYSKKIITDYPTLVSTINKRYNIHKKQAYI